MRYRTLKVSWTCLQHWLTLLLIQIKSGDSKKHHVKKWVLCTLKPLASPNKSKYVPEVRVHFLVQNRKDKMFPTVLWLISTMYRYRLSLKLWRKIEQTWNGKLPNLSAYQIGGHAMPEEIVYSLEHYCLYLTQLRQPITFEFTSWNVYVII